MAMKYRQRGYRESERGDGRDDRKPPPAKSLTPEERAQQRSLRHAVAREASEVLRCPTCGRNVQAFGGVATTTECPFCSAALHCCRACRHFDTASRWECRAPIEQRIGDKGKGNDCPSYEARLVLDATGKRTGTPSSNDPKSMFDSLFKR